MLLAPEAGEARLSQVLKPHQVDRIVAYTAQLRGDPRYDDDIGYQAAKALLATASGGVTGLGREGAARAVRLSGLPEAHNDMVFAVLVAQHGALGAVVVLGLYVAFGIGGLLIARSCAHPHAAAARTARPRTRVYVLLGGYSFRGRAGPHRCCARDGLVR